jgi:hypothetical protein
VAQRCSDLLEPTNCLAVTVLAVGWHVDGLAGAGWGLLAALFTVVWKISIHCAVASGSAALLCLSYGPLLLPVFLLVALPVVTLLGWARVASADHTVPQVVAGAVLGAAAAALAYAVIVT